MTFDNMRGNIKNYEPLVVDPNKEWLKKKNPNEKEVYEYTQAMKQYCTSVSEAQKTFQQDLLKSIEKALNGHLTQGAGEYLYWSVGTCSNPILKLISAAETVCQAGIHKAMHKEFSLWWDKVKLRGDYHLTSDEVDTCILLTSAIIKGNLMCGDSLFGELHKWNATIWCDIPNNFDYLDVASIHEAQQVLFPDHIPFNYELFSVKKRGMATSGGSLRIRKARPYER